MLFCIAYIRSISEDDPNVFVFQDSVTYYVNSMPIQAVSDVCMYHAGPVIYEKIDSRLDGWMEGKATVCNDRGYKRGRGGREEKE